jgi:hypothetical protein
MKGVVQIGAVGRLSSLRALLKVDPDFEPAGGSEQENEQRDEKKPAHQ